ncbi:ZIP zinc/iron transport family [Marasmius fiardii PR-910]|nr:ZIP zinc/iron transport family [Marasmius fiardii PR-910]
MGVILTGIARVSARESTREDMANKGLHVGAIFIMLIASAVGVLAPIVFHKCMTKGRLGGAFFIAKHFGTGVILCTALVHLLYHSFIMFNNSCMADNIEYEATAPTLALAAVLLTFFIDYAMHTYIRRNSKAEEAQTIKEKSSKTQSDSSVSQGPVPSSRQEIVNVQLLEAGIIFHSIMIGVSLGATGGSQWIPLLCAIVFHQLFEGLGLGSRISELTFSPRRGWNKFLMGLAFSVITPIGVAIGVGVHESYDPNSVSALAAIGVLNALSAGILLYTGVVEMLVNDFIHGELKDASIVRAGAAIFFILLGALGMAVIGKWA